MAELVTIIEQRNQIISSLDQDRYMETNKKVFHNNRLKTFVFVIRERDEDMESTRNQSESDKKLYFYFIFFLHPESLILC